MTAGTIVWFALILAGVAWWNGAFDSLKSDFNSASVGATNASVTGLKQLDFCNVMEDFEKRYQDAIDRNANEVELTELRHTRKSALQSMIQNGAVSEWKGYLMNITTSTHDTADFNIVVCGKKRDDDATTAALDDFFLNHVTFTVTDIKRGTPLYSGLMYLTKGTEITFSGTIETGGLSGVFDFVNEHSVTEHGSMEDPEINFDLVAFTPVRDKSESNTARHRIKTSRQAS